MLLEITGFFFKRIAAVKEIETARARILADMGPEARDAIKAMAAENTEQVRIRAAATVAAMQLFLQEQQ